MSAPIRVVVHGALGGGEGGGQCHLQGPDLKLVGAVDAKADGNASSCLFVQALCRWLGASIPF